MLLKLALVILLCFATKANSAKILGIFDFPSKSHHILGSALLKALAEKGHDVTMFSPFPLKKPVKNYEDIEITDVVKYKDEVFMTNMKDALENNSILLQMIKMRGYSQAINEMVLTQAADRLMKPDRKFDLVIQNWFFNAAYLGIANYFEAPVIAFSGVGATHLTNALMSNPAPYSYVPNIFMGLPSEMNFLQRVLNTVINIVSTLAMSLDYSAQKYMLEKYFPKAPPLHELEKNISLMLLNSHLSIESPRPYVPGMVQIGGFHVQEPKQLKGELKSFMDGAKEGVVYFSLGSNIQSASLPQHKLDAIVKTFAGLPVKVLWKFETDDIPNLPSNVKIGKWLPQGDILAHPNLKLFVTHGGLLSTTEAVHHGVPIVGIPLFADQKYNVVDSVVKGFAEQVSYEDLSVETLSTAIKRVLKDSRYRENVKKLSKIFKDQPTKPMETAIFWVEYVLRHKGAHHLKTSAVKLSWYQYFLLDVIALVVGVIVMAMLGMCYLLKKLVRILRFKKTAEPGKRRRRSKKSKTA